MPNGMKKIFDSKKYLLKEIRNSKLITLIFGPCYNTKYDFIEIDLTYDCNLKCLNCNRSCRQAPSTEEITTTQIIKFIDESIKNNRKWKGIRLIGGEPTMHHDILKIASLIVEYKKYSSDVSLRFATNGYENKSIIEILPAEFIVENSHKTTIAQDFTPINLAPVDLRLFNLVDFKNACPITELCGLGLTKYGYYHCAVAGAIDRVFGFNIGRKTMPEIGDQMIDEKRRLCKYCGHFLDCFGIKKTKKELFSKSWTKAFNKYRERRPRLSEY